MTNKKRRHHYVWRKYLRAWSEDEKIFCLRDKKIFNPNLMGVAQKRDFYKLNELSREDISFINELVIRNSPKELVDGHENLLKNFSYVRKLKDLLSDISNTNDEETKHVIGLYLHNYEEELHSNAENVGGKYLDELLNGNTDFFSTTTGFSEFIFFLNVQYFRTKKIKESVVNAFALNQPLINMEGCWNVLSHIFATNAAHSFCLDREKYKLVLINNKSELEFITSDQPVINVFSLSIPKNQAPERCALYYPISPKLAVLFIEKRYFEGEYELTFDERSVRSHNDAIINSSLEQVFASDKLNLEKICFPSK
jgi:hypothetical protein